jgi:hypothetical protein
LLPTKLVRARVHFISEWDLLVIAGWDDADFMNHSCETGVERMKKDAVESERMVSKPPSGISTSRKSEDADSVSFSICDSFC